MYGFALFGSIDEVEGERSFVCRLGCGCMVKQQVLWWGEVWSVSCYFSGKAIYFFPEGLY